MKHRFTEKQIIHFFELASSGVSIRKICLENGFSEVTFYTWRAKYSGMTAEALKKFRDIEREHSKLRKKLDESLNDIQTLKTVVQQFLPPSERKSAAYNICMKLHLSERKACHLLNISRSTLRH